MATSAKSETPATDAIQAANDTAPKFDFTAVTAEVTTDVITRNKTRKSSLDGTPFPAMISDSYGRKVTLAITVPDDEAVVKRTEYLIRRAALVQDLGASIDVQDAVDGKVRILFQAKNKRSKF